LKLAEGLPAWLKVETHWLKLGNEASSAAAYQVCYLNTGAYIRQKPKHPRVVHGRTNYQVQWWLRYCCQGLLRPQVLYWQTSYLAKLPDSVTPKVSHEVQPDRQICAAFNHNKLW